MERENVQVPVFEASRHWTIGDDWPDNLLEFQSWLAAHIESIPEQFRDSAVIELTGDGYEDDMQARMKIYYLRPETDEEFSARKRVVEEYQRARQEDERARELATLAALKRKYPEQGS